MHYAAIVFVKFIWSENRTNHQAPQRYRRLAIILLGRSRTKVCHWSWNLVLTEGQEQEERKILLGY